MYVRNPGSLEGRPALDSGGPFPPPCGIPAGLSFATGPYSGFGRVFVGQLVTKTDLAGLWRGCGHRTEKGGDPGRNRGKPPGPPRASAPYLAAGVRFVFHTPDPSDNSDRWGEGSVLGVAPILHPGVSLISLPERTV